MLYLTLSSGCLRSTKTFCCLTGKQHNDVPMMLLSNVLFTAIHVFSCHISTSALLCNLIDSNSKEVRHILEGSCRPELARVPGIAEVNKYEVNIDSTTSQSLSDQT